MKERKNFLKILSYLNNTKMKNQKILMLNPRIKSLIKLKESLTEIHTLNDKIGLNGCIILTLLNKE